MAELMGRAWDISGEYASLNAPELHADLVRVAALTTQIAPLSAQVAGLVLRAEALGEEEKRRAVAACQEAYKLREEAYVLISNVDVYLSCELSVDGRHAEAKTLSAKVHMAAAKLGQSYNAVEQFLKLTSDDVAQAFLKSPATEAERFNLMQQRRLRDHALSLAEEDLLIGLSLDGHAAWGTLYDNISSTLKCRIKLPEGERTMGLAEAATLSQDSRAEVREAAFRATTAAWESQEEAVAAGLNALAGWRLELYRRRSAKKPFDFLAEPLHRSRISRATLDAMLSAVGSMRAEGQRVLKLQAKLLGKDRVGPWDLFAPCPRDVGAKAEVYPYEDGVELIASAYAEVAPEMGAFVRMMSEKQWIEGRVGPSKRPGAYCTSFAKSRTPRVYMTYNGGVRELKTLAHELGHAFHNWVMRDQPLAATHYPMTLAETASIFGEMVVNGALSKRAKTPADRLAFAWGAAREVESFCLNIPARFHFEQAFYERRQEATLSPDDLKQLMREAWSSWYGDALSDMDPMFWASKLHFSIAGLSFYNFPYTFGYLFSLGVYAQREILGSKFYPAYVSLLRDTGRMTAEEVAAKHLGADLTRPEFWLQSLAIAKTTVATFEAAADAFNQAKT